MRPFDVPFDKLVLVALFAIGAVFLAGSFGIEQGAGGSAGDVGSRFAPRLFSLLLMLFSVAALVFRKRDEKHRLGADATVAGLVAVAIAYALALPALGYAIATFAALTIVLALLRAGAWWRIVLFSTCTTGALYLIFEKLLLVGLPVGPLKF